MPDVRARVQSREGQPISRASRHADRGARLASASHHQPIGRDQVGNSVTTAVLFSGLPFRLGRFPDSHIKYWANAGHVGGTPKAVHARGSRESCHRPTSIKQNTARQAGFARPPDLLECDFPVWYLNPSFDGTPALLAACAILGPTSAGTADSPREGGGSGGQSTRYGDLAWPAAELPARLMVHANRVLALLRERRVVDGSRPRSARPSSSPAAPSRATVASNRLVDQVATPTKNVAAATVLRRRPTLEPSSPQSARRSCDPRQHQTGVLGFLQ